MAEEPIRKEDIIDEVAILASLQLLIDKLRELGVSIESLKKVAAGMGDSLQKANPATPEGQAAIKQYSSDLEEVTKQTKILSDIEKEFNRRLEELAKNTGLSNKEIAAQTKALIATQKGFGGTKKEVDYAVGSLTDLRKKLNELEKAYANADPSKAGKMLDGVKKMRAEVDKAETAIGKHQRNVGNYGATLKELGKKFLAFTGITVGVQAAFKFIGDAMASTGAAGDELEMMTEGVKQGFDAIKRSVVNLDFKDFIKNVKAAYEEGRRYAEGLDAVDERTRALRVAEADASKEIINQLKISRSAKYSKDEQIAAGKKIVELEEKLAGIRTGIAEQAFQNEIDNIVQITGLHVDEVFSLLKMDAAMMKNIETGKKYNEFLKLNDKYIQSINASTGKSTFSEEGVKTIMSLRQEFANVNDEVKRYAFAANNLATDDKMQILTDKYVSLKSAETSALQGTMRVQTQIDAKEERINDKKIEVSKKVTEIITQNNLKEIQGIDAVIIKKGELNTTELKRSEYAKTANDAIIESNKNLIKSDEEVKQQRITSALKIFEVSSQAIGAVSNIFEAAKQRELSAAGDNAEKRAAIEKEYAKKQKLISISEAIINGAIGITQSFTLKPPMNIINAALVAVTTATQIAIIAAQKFAEGGEIFGKPHSQGGVHIEAEGGEYMIKKQSVSKYKGLIEAINEDNPMRIVEELKNRKFHTVWGGVSEQLSTVSKQDPYTRMMYELMKNDIKIYTDSNGDNVICFPDGSKRVVRKYMA
jgi:DNA-binding transcriptional MerR regulator